MIARSPTQPIQIVALLGFLFVSAFPTLAGAQCLPDPPPANGSINCTDGNDVFENLGAIDGDVDLGAGDDTLFRGVDGQITGTIFGGAGNDTIELEPVPNTQSRTFDLGATDGIESLRLQGTAELGRSGGIQLRNTETFTGSTQVLSGAVLQIVGPAPQTFAGGLTFESQSRLFLQAGQTTPPLVVEGELALNGGTVFILPPPSFIPQVGDRLPFIGTPGGTQGQFEEVRFLIPAGVRLLFAPEVEPEVVSLVFDDSFALLTQGESQTAIADHLSQIDQSGGASDAIQGVINDLFFANNVGGASDFNPVFNALSPEFYDIKTTLIVEGGRQVTSLLFDRPRSCNPGESELERSSDAPLPCHARKWSPWLATVGRISDRDGFDGHPRYDSTFGGLVLGLDAHPIGDLDLTFSIASQRGSINVPGSGESLINMTELTAHAAWSPGPLRLQLAGSYGHGLHTDRRLIRFTRPDDPSVPLLDASGDTNHDSNRFTVAAETSFLFNFRPNNTLLVGVEPIVGIDWSWVDQQSIQENNVGSDLGVLIGSRRDEVGSVTAGLRLSASFPYEQKAESLLSFAEGNWAPVADVRWREITKGARRNISARLVGTPGNVPNFRIQGEEDSGGLEIGAGLSFTPKRANRLQFLLRYEAYVAEHTLAQDFIAQLSLGF